MMGILKELYYGNFVPCEREIVPGSEEERLMEALCKAELDLKQAVDDKVWEQVKGYEKLQSELLLQEAETAWENGFRVGAMVMMDVWSQPGAQDQAKGEL